MAVWEIESKLLPPGGRESFSVGPPGNKKQENAATLYLYQQK